eukprot:3632988-Rhodomonas_salina.1
MRRRRGSRDRRKRREGSFVDPLFKAKAWKVPMDGRMTRKRISVERSTPTLTFPSLNLQRSTLISARFLQTEYPGCRAKADTFPPRVCGLGFPEPEPVALSNGADKMSMYILPTRKSDSKPEPVTAYPGGTVTSRSARRGPVQVVTGTVTLNRQGEPTVTVEPEYNALGTSPHCQCQ